jgi:hypothetical protein
MAMTKQNSRNRLKIAALLAAAAGVVAIAGSAATSAAQGQTSPAAVKTGGSLTAFRSDAELRRYLRSLRERGSRRYEPVPMPSPPSPPPPPSAPPPPGASSAPSAPAAESIVTTGMRVATPAKSQSITNTQEADVDEGGIVKVSGDHLVILRRGRLFTVSLAGGSMRPVDSIDAFPRGVSGRGDWYDEMLISGDRIVVVGYSYARGGTEVNRFRIAADGRLRFEDAYHLRSNDYYSSRNYASRLIGNRLIFYTPLYLDWDDDPLEALPGIRRWRGRDDGKAFKRIATARQVYIPPVMRRSGDAEIDTLHSVTDCDLTAPELDCSATAVLGPSSRTFYVSSGAVYLWMSNAWSWDAERRGAGGFLYRLPLGRQRPSAVQVRGAPVDQFSFREDLADGVLNVLLRAEGGGDAMWRPEVSGGDVALLRVRFRDFGDGSEEVPFSRYRDLPSPGGQSWSFRNRFVGEHVLYGGGAFGRTPRGGATLIAAPVRGGEPARLDLPHAVDRIEVMGRDAMVVGGQERGLGFTAVELAGRPQVGDHYLHPDGAEGESRSHAFFYNALDADGSSGILGLPVTRRVAPAYHRFFGSAAAMLFLRRDNRRLSPAGELAANPEGTVDDNCQASCVDWYGNARPIFLGNRTFALLGYELVEGALRGNRIREVERISFAPRAPRRGR